MKYTALILVLLAACGASTPLESSVAAKRTLHARVEPGVVASVLKDLSFAIDSLSNKKVITKWEQFYSYKGTDFQEIYFIRMVVYVKDGTILGQCTAYSFGSGFGKPCTNPILVKRIQFNVDRLASRIPVTVGE